LKDDVTRDWRKLHNGELLNKSRRMRLMGNGEKGNAYRLVGKPEGKRPLVKPRHRWVDNNEVELGEIGWGC
jgi:hypothetical protein